MRVVRSISSLVVFAPIGTFVRALLVSLDDGLERRLVCPPEDREHKIFGQPARILVDSVTLDRTRQPLIDVHVIASAFGFPSSDVVRKRLPAWKMWPERVGDIRPSPKPSHPLGELTYRHKAAVVDKGANWFFDKSVKSFVTSEPLELDPEERHKTQATVDKIHDYLFQLGIDRDDCVVAIGGGIVCDVVGFAASTYTGNVVVPPARNRRFEHCR